MILQTMQERRKKGEGGNSQKERKHMELMKRTALTRRIGVAGALTANLTAGLFPLSLFGWRWTPPSGVWRDGAC